MPSSPPLQRLSLLPLLLPLLFLAMFTNSQPLSTSGRWLIDTSTAKRMKLRCVNWAAHMPAVVAEGLDKQPLNSITMRAASLGFNCVRLTWATHLFTKEHYENLTVGESLRSLGLDKALEGVKRNNGGMVGMGVREAYDEVVKAIGDAGMMVVLDNHVSRPQWCCGGQDGNGFFGDLYFDPDDWLIGLDFVARRFRGYSQVIGMSMRNELRGPRESQEAWYRNITEGASRIHEANPNVLVIVSGLHYDTDLSFLHHQPLNSTYDNKLVFEVHWYSFSIRRDWANKSPNIVCSSATKKLEQQAAFLVKNDDDGDGGTPLFVSEFGVDQRGWNRADNRFLSCFLMFAAEKDLDWALWALQGSYYKRNGVVGLDETYGVFDFNWDQPRNPKFQQRFRLIQQMLQVSDSSSNATYQIIYHPHSGKCLNADENNKVLLSDCQKKSRWNYNGEGSQVQLVGSTNCLQLVGDGLPVVLSSECDDNRSTWKAVSESKYQIFAKDLQGRALCLEGNSTEASILTKECLCLGNSTCSENPQVQWFNFVPSNIP
ncbi:glycosyl hydrolase 5 family protein-like [Dioscorea cayenensis subsp. rotundata]|uniref:Glycosyl hydrolase 5 family protein-like n=1 Tax=Dioscorea cayennensis subsp. rotundata TaxID=55577 RepID=A0AB40B375_DIOCR|nr:glycosyl hydrolase 5 family protein-like [Dioscorea cayenensis subsp. rotundata]